VVTGVSFAIGSWTLELVEPGEEHESFQVGVADAAAAVRALHAAVRRAPVSARVLADLLTITASVPVEQGLVAESLAYSMLMAGDEHRRWLAGRSPHPPPDVADAVVLERSGERLTVLLNRPDRHNAYGRQIRDGLCEALELVGIDDTITAVTMRGAGRSFCSGGDLDEFGTSRDVAVAHVVRRERSAAELLHRVHERVEARLHGACIGAGIEIPSFADRVVAAHDTTIRLPELGMGLVPGAGGTVGITRRIGPWRTLFLALSGVALDAVTARRWGLVDALDE